MATNDDGLPEDKFINESYSKNPSPFWIWLGVLAAVITFAWGTLNWLGIRMNEEVSSKPFLQVTNRQFSLFLWQFPQFMRGNMPAKLDNLPGFYYSNGKVGLKPEDAETTVRTPPEILFLYHTWDRLLKEEFTPRAIPLTEFLEFLDAAQAWSPENWADAPAGYAAFIDQLSTTQVSNLENASSDELPLEVRMAFQGWKNFFKEGDAINKIDPTLAEMQEFISTHTHYARNYWRNIVMKDQPDYLASLSKGDGEGAVPENEMTAFLKTAYFNYAMAKEGN
jgi:hypothetical protein